MSAPVSRADNKQDWVSDGLRYRGVSGMLGFTVELGPDGAWTLLDRRSGRSRVSRPFSSAAAARETAAQRVAA